MRPKQLVANAGGAYSAHLGIDLRDAPPAEVYKWFVASLLFGAHISGTLAERAYLELGRAQLLTPQRMRDAGWDRLVQTLDQGGYVRYDFKTATKLLDINEALLHSYGGDLNALHAAATDETDLERRLRGLGKGIGDVTVNIFLRELRGIWPKAAPLPSERAIRSARALHLLPARLRDRKRILAALQDAWRADGGAQQQFVDFEAALVRHALRKHGTRSR